MASILPVGVSDIRGKVGDTIFSRNSFGLYTRPFVKPTDTVTTWTEKFLESAGYCVGAWYDLTEGQRQAWRSCKNFTRYNRFGKAFRFSGRYLFFALNINYFQFSVGSLLAEPPTPICIPPLKPSLSADSSVPEIIFSASTAATDSDFQIIVRASRSLSAGRTRTFRPDFLQLDSVYNPEDASTDLFSDWDTRTSSASLDPDLKLWIICKLLSLQTGQCGPWAKTFCIIT